MLELNDFRRITLSRVEDECKEQVAKAGYAMYMTGLYNNYMGVLIPIQLCLVIQERKEKRKRKGCRMLTPYPPKAFACGSLLEQGDALSGTP